MAYSPILATLAYILSPDKSKVLMIHRDKDPKDHHFGKYNGLGGKVEPGEHVVNGIIREVREEAGIECQKLVMRGTISWPGFGKKGEDWFAFIFRVDSFTGTPLADNPEGTLEWAPVEKITTLPMWEGDRSFLPLVLGNDERQFHGVMPYEKGRPTSWTYQLI